MHLSSPLKLAKNVQKLYLQFLLNLKSALELNTKHSTAILALLPRVNAETKRDGIQKKNFQGMNSLFSFYVRSGKFTTLSLESRHLTSQERI